MRYDVIMYWNVKFLESYHSLSLELGQESYEFKNK